MWQEECVECHKILTREDLEAMTCYSRICRACRSILKVLSPQILVQTR